MGLARQRSTFFLRIASGLGIHSSPSSMIAQTKSHRLMMRLVTSWRSTSSPSLSMIIESSKVYILSTIGPLCLVLIDIIDWTQGVLDWIMTGGPIGDRQPWLFCYDTWLVRKSMESPAQDANGNNRRDEAGNPVRIMDVEALREERREAASLLGPNITPVSR